MELVPANADEKDLRQEVNRRTARAGYTDRDGQAPVGGIRSRWSKDYSDKFDEVFGRKT